MVRVLSPAFLILAAGALLAPGASAQVPRIGVIDFFGVHKVPQAKLRQALGAREGDPLPASKGDAEDRIDQISGVVESHLEGVCCDDGKVVLYIGIEERGAPHFDLREPPDDDVQLPDEIKTQYQRFLDASAAADRLGQTAQDLTTGQALSQNSETREIQQEFSPIAKKYIGDLRHVLRDSSDEEQRAIAAYVIAYNPDKKDIVDDLQFALKDADPGVRANATRGLKALAVLAYLHPDSGVKVEPTWFIEMLNSLSWSDRRQALEMLQILTDHHEQSTLDQLHDRALASLVEMARWKTLGHALPAYILLGRIAGIPDDQAQAQWSRGDRETVIAMLNAPSRKK